MIAESKNIEIKSAGNITDVPAYGGLINIKIGNDEVSNSKTKLAKLLREQGRKSRPSEPNFRALIEIGDYHFSTNSFNNASKTYIKALKLSKSNFTVYQKLITALIALKKFNLADKFYKELIENSNNSNKFTAQYLSFKIATSLGNNETEILVRNNLDSSDDNIQNNVGLYYLLLNEQKNAFHHFKKALDINSDNIDANNNISIYYKLIGELDEALKYLHKANYLDLKYFAAYENLASIYYSQGHTSKAVDILEQAKNNSVELSLLWKQNYAMFLSEIGEYERSNNEFKKLLNEDSSNHLILNNIGANYQKLELKKEAISYFKRAINIFKKNKSEGKLYDNRSAIMFNNISQIYLESKDIDSAQEYAEYARDTFPTHNVAFHQLGHINHIKGNISEAKDLFDKSLELNPRYSLSVIELSYILEDVDFDFDTSISVIEKHLSVLNGADHDPLISNNLAYAYLKVGRIDDAKPLISNSTSSFDFPNSATKGFYYLLIGDIEEAEKLYKEAEKYAPENKKVLVRKYYYYELMKYWQAQNNLVEAFKLANLGNELNTNNRIDDLVSVALNELKALISSNSK